MDCRMGAREGVQDIRFKAEIWSAPVPLLVSSVVSSFIMPLIDTSSSGIGG